MKTNFFNGKGACAINFTLLVLVMSIVFSCSEQKKEVLLKSPDNSYAYSLRTSEKGEKLLYSVGFNKKEIVSESGLGFDFGEKPEPAIILIEEIVTSSINTSWKPVYGEKKEYSDVYNEAYVTFSGLNYALRVRAYDEGIAFRYEFNNKGGQTKISSEETEFRVPAEATAWVSTRAQSEITKVKISDMEEVRERPILLKYSDSLFVAIGEAGLVDYARMKFINKKPGTGILKSVLDGEVKYDRAFNTPWRFVMAAETPGKILENNYLLLNLNEPNKIEDTSWIKPGKVIREVTLTTKGGMACVDFAVKHNLQFVEFDAGWYGNESDEESDATTVTVDPKRSPGPLELKKVINYAKEQGVGILLYVNRRSLEKQIDEVLPLLKSWGVAGVKYGFVNVGTQKWTNWLHDAIRKAAENELMIDVHDEYRPTGYSRTYPNLMTQEGIRGDEESPSNTMVINTIFTRMIAGAGDQTNCYFAERVTEKMGSHVSQMAKAVCIYSPWQFVYWYDRPIGSPVQKGGAGGTVPIISEVPELEFFDGLPTVWDDTKVIHSEVGELATIARKSGNDWYVGSIIGTTDKSVLIPLNFLDKSKDYEATIYFDDEKANPVTRVGIEKIAVNSNSVISRNLLKNNGLAMYISER